MPFPGGRTRGTQGVFPCTRCGKTFVSREALRNHLAQCEEQEHPQLLLLHRR